MPPLNRFQKSCIALAVGQALIPTNNIHAATIDVDPQGTVDGCTLLDAVASANGDSNVGDCVGAGAFGSDTLVMPSATFTITSDYDGPSSYFGGLPVTSNITIQGNDALMVTDLDGGENARFFDVSSGGNLTLNEITLGSESGSFSFQGGRLGFGGEGGAIRVTDSTLTINSSSLIGNSAGFDGEGGAIFGESSTITLNNVFMASNGGQKYDDADIANTGGAIAAFDSTLDINQSLFVGNNSKYGGAIYAFTEDSSKYSTTISNSTFIGNSAKYSGGGALTVGSDVTVNNSSFIFNRAGTYFDGPPDAGFVIPGSGGAITTIGGEENENESPLLSVSDSSFTFNLALLKGSAISIDRGAELNIDKSSLSFNLVKYAGDGDYVGDGSVAQSAPTVQGGLLDGSGKYGGTIAIGSNGGENHAITNSTLSENFRKYYGLRTRSAAQNTVAASPSVEKGIFFGAPRPTGILQGSGNLTLTNSTIVDGRRKYNGLLVAAASTAAGSNTPDPEKLIGPGNNQGRALFAYGSDTTVTLQNSVISHSLARGDNANPYLRGNGGEFQGNDGLCNFSAGAVIGGESTNNFFAGFSCAGYSIADAALPDQGGETFDVGIGQVGDPRLGRRSKYGNSGKYSVGAPRLGGETTLNATTIHVPLFNSPLLKAGDLDTCRNAPVGGEDQRGILHPEGHCDIGAIDARNTVVTVNSIGGEVGENDPVCTLNDALRSASNTRGSKYLKYDDSPDLRPGSTCAQSVDLTTIQFDPNVFPSNSQTTISLSDELEDINTPVSIEGPGSNALTIMQTNDDRIFDVNSGNLYMSGVTISGGERSSGGAIDVDQSDIHLNEVVLTGNKATQRGGALRVAYSSNAYVRRSTISNNSVGLTSTSSSYGGGGISVRDSRLIMEDSTVSANVVYATSGASNNSAVGGGVAVYEAYAKITNSTISGNSAYNGGGFSANSNLNTGGPLKYAEQPSTIRVLNTTITDNHAMNNGGGIFIDADNNGPYGSPGSFFNSNASIISGNEALGMGDEIALNKYTNVNLNRSLLGSDASTYAEAIYNDGGSFSLGGGGENILVTSDEGNIPIEDILKPLASNGGPTQTHALVNGSPAIDALLNGCRGGVMGPFSSDITKDQRGFARSDGSCDIGSFEFDGTVFYIIRAANGNIITFSL